MTVSHPNIRCSEKNFRRDGKMKQNVCILFLIGMVYFAGCETTNNSQGISIPSSEQEKIDSVFNSHFVLLDSILNKEYEDSHGRRINSISFLEKVSGLTFSTNSSFIGKTFITNKDFAMITEWYNSNRLNLDWNQVKRIAPK